MASIKKSYLIPVIILAAAGIAMCGYAAFRITSHNSSPAVVTKSTDNSSIVPNATDSSEASAVTTSYSKTDTPEITGTKTVPVTLIPKEQYIFPADINKVSKEQLMEIDSIGDSTASAIIQYRNDHNGFHSLEELLNINGIGDKKYQLLKQYLFITDDMTTITTTSTTTTAKATTTIASITETVTSPAPQRRSVNINKASAEELAECLLIHMDTAEAIVILRERLGSFSNTLELLYVEDLQWKDAKISEELYNQIKDYCTLE